MTGLQLSRKATGGDGVESKRCQPGQRGNDRDRERAGPLLAQAQITDQGSQVEAQIWGPCHVKVLAMGGITKADASQLRGEIQARTPWEV